MESASLNRTSSSVPSTPTTRPPPIDIPFDIGQPSSGKSTHQNSTATPSLFIRPLGNPTLGNPTLDHPYIYDRDDETVMERESKCCICFDVGIDETADESRTAGNLSPVFTSNGALCLRCPNKHLTCFACFASGTHSYLNYSLEKARPKKEKDNLSEQVVSSSTTSVESLEKNDTFQMFDINHITLNLGGKIQIKCGGDSCTHFFTDEEMMDFFSFGLFHLKEKNANLDEFKKLRQNYFKCKEDYAYLLGEREGLNKAKRMTSEDLENESLRIALGGEARQCRKCDYGPLLHSGCSSITTHQNEVRRNKNGLFVIDNRCPKCDHLESDWRMYPQWNGRFPTEDDKRKIQERLEARKEKFTNRLVERTERRFKLALIVNLLSNEFRDVPLRGDHQERERRTRILNEELEQNAIRESAENAEERSIREQLELLECQTASVTENLSQSLDNLRHGEYVNEIQTLSFLLEELMNRKRQIEQRNTEIWMEIKQLDKVNERIASLNARFQQLREMTCIQMEEEFKRTNMHHIWNTMDTSRKNGSFEIRDHMDRSATDLFHYILQEERNISRHSPEQSSLLTDLGVDSGLGIRLGPYRNRGYYQNRNRVLDPDDRRGLSWDHPYLENHRGNNHHRREASSSLALPNDTQNVPLSPRFPNPFSVEPTDGSMILEDSNELSRNRHING